MLPKRMCHNKMMSRQLPLPMAILTLGPREKKSLEQALGAKANAVSQPDMQSLMTTGKLLGGDKQEQVQINSQAMLY